MIQEISFWGPSFLGMCQNHSPLVNAKSDWKAVFAWLSQEVSLTFWVCANILWMDEILRDLRNPGMIRCPNEKTNKSWFPPGFNHGFKVVPQRISSIHRKDLPTKSLGSAALREAPPAGASKASAKIPQLETQSLGCRLVWKNNNKITQIHLPVGC